MPASEQNGMTRAVCVLLAAMLLGAAAAAQSADAPLTASSVESLIEHAVQTRVQAADMGAEWLETRTLVERAREQLEQGNLEQAASLADRARKQGELAIEQATREANAWKQRVIR